MANRKVKRVVINPVNFKIELLKKGISINKLASDIGWSSKTIQRAIRDKQMTPWLVEYICEFLGISSTSFVEKE